MAIAILFIGVGVSLMITIGPTEAVECPSISSGIYPNCRCRYGPMYDEVTNTCPNPECPVNNSSGTYPNCTCLNTNFDYSIYLNECFRVCPEYSSGYWPQCHCDTKGYVFDKSLFVCRACPAGSIGEYPNCSCGEAVYDNLDNLCVKCGNGSVGTYPNCTCSDNAIYDAHHRRCVLYSKPATPGCDDCNDKQNVEEYRHQCPIGSVGYVGNCVCEGNGTYNESMNVCIACPYQSFGVYPDCVCENNGKFLEDLNWCYACPAESSGEYPNCLCEHPLQYVNRSNECVGCPQRSIGTYPNCNCKNGFFSKTLNKCIECPLNSSGFYPDCKCRDDGVIFSPFINECYIMCPENSSGIHPNCQCDFGSFYDVDALRCESNIGRRCPIDSIGIGPDCLCMRENTKFNSYSWNCLEPGGISGFTTSSPVCPDNTGKWPQCEASIERNTLISLIG